MKLLRYEKFIHKSELNEGIVRKFYDKAKIKYLCKKYDIKNYTINEDGTIDVDGDVYPCRSVRISEKGLTELPLKFGKVGGDFYCSINKLVSLEGAPREVGGDFSCSINQLVSLEGSPEKVGGNFGCNGNQLTSLVGSPEKVGGNFGCNGNQLTSLVGSPNKVDGNFYCKNNNLTSLDGISKYISKQIHCENNHLRDVKGVKDGWRGGFTVKGNPVHEIFKLFPEDRWDEVIEYLNEYDVIRDGKVVILQALELVFHEMGLEVPDIEEIEGYEIQF